MTLVEFLLARLDDDEAVVALGAEVRHEPARALAEVQAKRHIVAECVWAESDPACHEILHHLAAPYDDHPAYRDEWRPHGPAPTLDGTDYSELGSDRP